MESELSLSHEQMGNIASFYYIAYAIMNLFWGILTDKIGPRKCILIGLAVQSFALASMGFMSSMLFGFISYFFIGVGAAAMSTASLRLLNDWFSGKRKDLAIGVYMAGAGTLIVTTGFVVPLILLAYSWRWAWWLGALYAFAIVIVMWFLLVDSPEEKGLSRLGHLPEKPTTSTAQPVMSNAVLPSSSWSYLKQLTMWNLAAIYFLWAMGVTIFTTFAVTYLEETGWDTPSASAVMSTWGALSILSPIAWGLIASHLPKKYVMAIALALEAGGIFIFLSGTKSASYLGAALAGFADMGHIVAMQASVGDYFHPFFVGRTYGIIVLGFGVGAIIGPSLGGSIADAAGSLHPSILLGSAVILVSVLLALILKKPVKNS